MANIEELVGFKWKSLAEYPLHPSHSDTFAKAILRTAESIDHVYANLRLDGSPLTLEQVQTLHKGYAPGGLLLEHQAEAERMIKAWQAVLRNSAIPGFVGNTTFYATLLHGILTEGTGLGACRLDEDADTVLAAISAQIAQPLERAVVTYLYLIDRGFFYAKNETTARLVMSSMLMSAGIRPLQVVSREIPAFKMLLAGFFESRDGTQIMEFIVQACYPGLRASASAQEPEAA